MKKATLPLTFFLLFIISFSGSFFGYSTTIKNERKNNNTHLFLPERYIPEFLSDNVSFEKNITIKYVLKDYKGKLGVFSKQSDGKEILYELYDVSISSLPEKDRKRILQGLEKASLSDILQVVEDYIA